MNKIRAYLLLAMAPVFLVGGILNLYDGWKVQSAGEAVEAKVQEIEQRSGRRGRKVEWAHLVATTSAGEQRCEIQHAGLAAGDAVAVLAVPDASGEALCKEPGFLSVWGLGTGLTCIGAPFFLLIGLGAVATAKEQEKENDAAA